jgi:adenylate cyclase
MRIYRVKGMKRRLHRFFNRTRTLKVKIITLFLSLISIAFLCVISFTYSVDYKTIMQFSKGTAEGSVGVVLAKFNSIALATERETEIAAGFFPTLGDLSIDNKEMITYMLNVMKYNENVSDLFVGFPNGDFIGVFNHATSMQAKYVSRPTDYLPLGTQYSVRFVDHSQDPPLDKWFYLNEQLQQVGKETLLSSQYDSRSRPWYQGAQKTNGLFWTGFYIFDPQFSEGISVAFPMKGPQGNVIGVVGADLTFSLLSDFLLQQRIGKTGRAFILSKKGEIIAPYQPGHLSGEEPISKDLVGVVFDLYAQTPQRADYVIDFQGVDYLAYVADLPVVFGADWKILTIAPLDDFFGEMIEKQKQVLLMIVAILGISALIVAYFASKISSPIVILAEEVNKISQLDLESNVRVHSNIKEIAFFDQSITVMRRVIRSFSRYVPKEIVKDLFLKNEDIELGGEKREITIFFSDIAGFTSIAEAHSIEVLIPLLTEYFDAMSSIILQSHGTIDKFLGDGIMAFWGAPIHFADHASRACTAALRCHLMLKTLNERRRKEGMPEFITRFGINTGTVIVGNLGTKDRMNYTVIGDAVNTTSRLQEVDKLYHTSIIISEDVYSRLEKEFVARPLDIVEVKGRKEKIKIYELMGKAGGESQITATAEEVLLSDGFTKAYEAFQNNQIEEAKKLFQALSERFPGDYPTLFYLQRIKSI